MHQTFEYEDGTPVTRCPGFTFYDTSGYADDSDPIGGGVKPDICLYHNAHLDKIRNGVKKPKDKYSDMGFSALHFEVKATAGQDFFRDVTDEERLGKGGRGAFDWIVHQKDDHNTSLTKGDKARHDLGQTVAYATEACKRQHRRHYFTVSVSGSSIRFIRWDRAGAIVSEKFNILKHPELFCQFFWRFAHITDAERGYDLTVEPATPEQEETFRQAVEDHVIAQLGPSQKPSDLQTAVEEHYQPGAVSVIHSSTSLPLLRTP